MNAANLDTATATAPWWRGAVIYQIYPRSFADTNGDGVGDLPGITSRLEYVASLGVDAIWLSPFFTSPMRDFGYDISNYCDVDPLFGTLADFDRLLQRAHTLGLRVIIDQVYSHTSDLHPWFEESRSSGSNPRADWYVWADPKPDGTPPNNWQSVFGGPAWEWDARRRQYYLHNFLASQPDLNVHHPQVQAALLEVGRFWLERGVDGFRLDAINYAFHDPLFRSNPPTQQHRRPPTRSVDYQQGIYNKSRPELAPFIESVRALTDQYSRGGQERFSVAEIGGEDADADMKFVTAGPRRLQTAYGFDFLLADRLSSDLVRKVVETWPETQGVGWPSWACSNHDAPRAATRLAGDHLQPDRTARLCLLLLISLRGNVFLYQGEELGLPQASVAFEDLRDPEAIANWPATLGRDGARTPMPWEADAPYAGFSQAKPWLPVSPTHLPLAVNRQVGDPNSIHALTRRLLDIRRNSTALRFGSMRLVPQPPHEGGADVLVFARRYDNDERLFAFNFGTSAATAYVEDASRWHLQESIGGATLAALPPGSALLAIRRS